MKNLFFLALYMIAIACHAENNKLIETAMRDPFVKITEQNKNQLTKSMDVASYDLNELLMLGTLQIGSKFFAVVSDPNGRTYTVKQGDKLNHRQLQILNINANGLEVKNLAGDDKPFSWLLSLPVLEES